MATSKCKHCGQPRTADDELGLYCPNPECGRPRLPFSWIFVWPWLALTATYFVTELAQPDERRPLFNLILLLAVAWSSALILRHRRRATLHVITILLALAVVMMHPVLWGAPPGSLWSPPLTVVSAILVVAAWVTLVAYVIYGLWRGFALARQDSDLGTGSLLVVIMALLGVLVTILYFVLPFVLPLARATLGGTQPGQFLIDALENLQFVVGKIEQYRLAAVFVAGFFVLGIATISALRRAYRGARRFSATGQAFRVIRAIARNVLELVLDSVTRLVLILRGIAPILFLVVASAIFTWSLFQLSAVIEILWTSTEAIPLDLSGWALFAAYLVVCGLTWIAMLAVGSSRLITDSGRIARDVVRDVPKLAQAVLYSAFILSLSFLLTWFIALAHQVVLERELTGVFLFAVTIALYALLSAVDWLLRGRRVETSDGRPSLLPSFVRRRAPETAGTVPKGRVQDRAQGDDQPAEAPEKVREQV